MLIRSLVLPGRGGSGLEIGRGGAGTWPRSSRRTSREGSQTLSRTTSGIGGGAGLGDCVERSVETWSDSVNTSTKNPWTRAETRNAVSFRETLKPMRPRTRA
jgi:hypothetical protein